jgi:flagellin-like hook-associated protein FlgL
MNPRYLCLFLPLVLLAQEQPSASDTAALRAELDNLKAQYDVLKLKNDLATLQATPTPAEIKAKAEQDADDKARVDAINALAALSGKLPAGNYTASADGVATPLGLQLAFGSLTTAAKELGGVLAQQNVGGKKLVFVDAIPTSPRVTLEKTLYDKLLADVEKDGTALLEPPSSGGAVAESLALAPVLITALPSILNAVGGFFRVDVTEKTFDAKLGAGTAISTVVSQLPTPRPSAIYFSLESCVFAEGIDFAKSDLVQAIERVKKIDGNLEAKAKLESRRIAAEEKRVADATVAQTATKAKVEKYEGRIALLEEMAKDSAVTAPDTAARYLKEIEKIGEEMAQAEATLAAQTLALEAAKTALTAASAPRAKINAVRDRIAKLFTALSSTEGTPPLFVRLMRDEAFAKQTGDDLRLVALSVASSVQGTVTKKRFWGQTNFGSSLVVLEYRVADGSGKLLTAGILPYYDFKKLTP